MKKIVDFLNESRVQYLATVGINGRPSVRPFQFMVEQEGKLWFCTSNKKEVYRELQMNPRVEFCATARDMSWLRLSGRVVFSDELKVKEKVFELSPLVKSIYKQPDNPDFEVFYLEDLVANFAQIGSPGVKNE